MPVVINGTTGISGVDGSASTPALQGSDTNTGVYFGADTVYLVEGGVEGLRLNSSGNTQLAGNLGLGGTTPSTSGTGITFPATQSASSDANTLDDYEEGTWTPTLRDATTTTYTTQSGRYTKIGRVVHAEFSLTINSVGNGNANVMAGLPFSNGASFSSGGSVNSFSTSATNVVFLTTLLASGETTPRLRNLTAAAAATLASDIFQNGTTVSGFILYTV